MNNKKSLDSKDSTGFGIHGKNFWTLRPTRPLLCDPGIILQCSHFVVNFHVHFLLSRPPGAQVKEWQLYASHWLETEADKSQTFNDTFFFIS